MDARDAAPLLGKCAAMLAAPHGTRWVQALLWTLGAALLAWGPARVARACAVCGCGDSTLSVTGTEAPLGGRVRTGAEVRALEDSWAGPVGGTTVMRDVRTTLVASFAPLRHLMLSVALPVVARDVVLPNLARVRTVGLGDVDLRARLFVMQDRFLQPRHQLSAHAGVLLPTALALSLPGSAAAARRRPRLNAVDEAVGGMMSVMPLLGVTYQMRPWSQLTVQSTVNLQVPVAFTTDTRVGAMANVLGAVQWQPVGRAALRGLLEGRAASPTRVGGLGTDKNSGGAVLFSGGEVVASPWTDLLFTASIRVPVWNALHGRQQVGPVLAVGVIRDGS